MNNASGDDTNTFEMQSSSVGAAGMGAANCKTGQPAEGRKVSADFGGDTVQNEASLSNSSH